MGLVYAPAQGLVLSTSNGAYGGSGYAGAISTMAAANRGVGAVGRLRLQSPNGGSKTLSAAGGGKICWIPWTTTFSNAGTTVRLGIQDVASTGIGDTTWDVYGDLVGGTDTITGFTYQSAAMTSGSKTMNEGDIIAIMINMTSRGGSDSVGVGYHTNAVQFSNNSMGGYPYLLSNTGGTWVKGGTAGGMFGIEFDDGTVGWIDQNVFFPFGPYGTDGSDYNLNSSPDEYAAIIQIPFKCSIYGLYTRILNVGTSDAFEVIAYSDPEGTPAAMSGGTITVNPAHFRSGGGVSSFYFSAPLVLEANTPYGFSFRPTTSGNPIAITYIDMLSSANAKWKKVFPFDLLKLSARTNQSGAFTEVNAQYAPIIGLYLAQVDDGTGSGGGESVSAY